MDKSCLASAGLFCLSNLIGAIFLAKYHQQQNHDFALFQQFNVEFIQKEWKWRNEHFALETAAGVCNAVAWFILAIPLLQVAWVQYQLQNASVMQQQQQQQQQGTNITKALGLHMTIALLAVGGAITELTSHLMYLGTTNALEWLSKDFTLVNWVSNSSNNNDEDADDAAGGSDVDSVGWKTLELVHIALRGMLLWISAMEMLFLAIIFLLLFVSIKSQHVNNNNRRLFSMKWVYFGVILAALCSLDFAAEILRFENWRLFSAFSILITFLNRVILFPAWLLWLGRQLPGAIQMVTASSAKEATTTTTRDETSSSSTSTLEVVNLATETNFT